MEKSKDTFMQMREEEQGLIITEKSFLRLPKIAIIEMAQATVDKYTDGFNSPYEGKLLAKKLIDLGEAINANISDNAANELKLAKGEKREVLGTTVTEQMVGVRYDYASTGDKEWLELNAKLKAREKLLQGITGSITMVDTDTGETYEVSEPVKSGKLALVIKY